MQKNIQAAIDEFQAKQREKEAREAAERKAEREQKERERLAALAKFNEE